MRHCPIRSLGKALVILGVLSGCKPQLTEINSPGGSSVSNTTAGECSVGGVTESLPALEPGGVSSLSLPIPANVVKGGSALEEWLAAKFNGSTSIPAGKGFDAVGNSNKTVNQIRHKTNKNLTRDIDIFRNNELVEVKGGGFFDDWSKKKTDKLTTDMSAGSKIAESYGMKYEFWTTAKYSAIPEEARAVFRKFNVGLRTFEDSGAGLTLTEVSDQSAQGLATDLGEVEQENGNFLYQKEVLTESSTFGLQAEFQLAGGCKKPADDSMRKQTAKDVKELYDGVAQVEEIEKKFKASTEIAEKAKYSEAAAQIATKLEPTVLRLTKAIQPLMKTASKAVPYVGEIVGVIAGFADAVMTFEREKCLPNETTRSCNLNKGFAATYAFAQNVFTAMPPKEELKSGKDGLVVLLKSMVGVYSIESIRKAFTAKATCPAGYEPVGSLICRKMGCPAYYKDQGATCFQGAQIEQANNSACPAANKCGLSGLAGAGCSTCRDPSFHNDGCTCRRDPHLIWKEIRGSL